MVGNYDNILGILIVVHMTFILRPAFLRSNLTGVTWNIIATIQRHLVATWWYYN